MGLKVGPMDVTWSKLGRLLTEPSYAGRVLVGNTRRAGEYVRTYRERRRVEQGMADFPRNLTISLTYRCNLRCKMCNLWGENGMCLEETEKANPHSDLSYEQFMRVYDEVRDKSERIYLFGGEPTLHPRFLDLLRDVTPGKVRLTLETNGLLLPKQAGAILDCAPLDSANVSIDGPPEVHDTIRGMKGAFEKSMAGVRALRERARQKGRPFTIGLRFIITEDNYDRIFDFAELVRDEPIDVLLLQHVMYQHEAIWQAQMRFTREKFGLEVGWDRSMPPPPRRVRPEQVVEHLHRIRDAGYPFDVVINPAYPDEDVQAYYRASETLPEPAMDCSIIWDQMFIDSRGEVMLCTSVSAGHIDEATVEEIWNGERYRRLRQVVRENRYMPYCKICCYLGEKKPMQLS